ncbi:hypothetical protein Ancab_003757 [Ancistrocladus abbreviatus]
MVSDAELIERLHQFLRSSDLKETTNSSVRRKLEEDFGIDLSERRAFIREQVDIFLHSQLEKSEEYCVGEREDFSDRENDDSSAADDDDDGDDEADSDGEVIVAEQEAASAGSSSRKARFRTQKREANKRGYGFAKLCALSPQLQKFLGVSKMAQTEVVQQLWNYIRERNLQDPNDRETIICDQLLYDLLGVDSINIFQMNKVLSKYMWPQDSESAGPAKTMQRERQRKQVGEEDPNEAERKGKRQRTKYSGFLAPVPLSDSLMKFLGTGESKLTRGDVIKRIWDYIKDNSLQDPSDKKTVICDEKLKELFQVDAFHGFTVSKLLSPHLLRASLLVGPAEAPVRPET